MYDSKTAVKGKKKHINNYRECRDKFTSLLGLNKTNKLDMNERWAFGYYEQLWK